MQFQTARKFVNRTDEISLASRVIEERLAGIPADEYIINFHGVPGMGKSALLAQICHEYQQNENLFTIAIDLETLAKQASGSFDLHHAKILFLRELWICLNISPQDVSAESDDVEIEQHMINAVNKLSQVDRPIMLLIDSWEHAPEAMLAWVERLLLLPLVRTQRVVCFMGSQVALRWRQFEVRRRVRQYELQPLDSQATIEQVGCAEELTQLVFSVTSGLPFANEIMFNYTSQEPVSVTWLNERQEWLAKIISNEIQQRVIAGMTFEIRQIFPILSLFREFDVHTLQMILPQFIPEFRNRSQTYLLLAIKQMVATRLVNWNDTLRAYQIDPTIRKIFAHTLEWADPDRYQSIQQAALDYYANLIREVPSNRHVYIVEFFYHDLYKASTNGYNTNDLQTGFEHMLRKYYVSPDRSYVDAQSLDSLRTLIEQDEEFQQALEADHLSRTLLYKAIDAVIASVQSDSAQSAHAAVVS